jgi:hypothetical protein
MKIFPSDNEKTITVVLVASSLSMVIGLLVGAKVTDANVLITSLATLVSAFVGAWFAYKLQDKAKRRQETERQVDKANDLLFALYQKLNALKLFQIDSIEPWRNNPGKMFAMQPVLNFKLPEAPIKPENINFLLKTKHKQLLFDTHIEEQRFEVAENVIRHRSNVYYQYIQPALHAAGIIEGVTYTDTQFKSALGELLYKRLEDITEQVVYHVDSTVESSDNLREKLIKAVKETYPNEEIINFVLLDKTPNKASQPTPKSGAPEL